jgi:hypothetical protein
MRIDSEDSNVNFGRLKESLEELYDCLGITCAQVGGLYKDGEYMAGADLCFDGAPIVDRTPEDSKADDADDADTDDTDKSSNNLAPSTIIIKEEEGGVNAGVALGIFLAVLMVMAICGIGASHMARSRQKSLEDGENNIAAVTAVSEVDLA